MEVYGKYSAARLIPTTLEETLEMAGVAIFLYALLSYISLTLGSLIVQFRASPSGAARAPARSIVPVIRERAAEPRMAASRDGR